MLGRNKKSYIVLVLENHINKTFDGNWQRLHINKTFDGSRHRLHKGKMFGGLEQRLHTLMDHNKDFTWR